MSDDTQLRLSTSRSISSRGQFDPETFSAIELTVWPAYALGAGRGSIAAATNLRKRDVTWASNFFSTRGAEYLAGGGNGAAMRIQPHVWAASVDGPEWSWLGDVIVNAVCTHGHARGFGGAAFHAACVEYALRNGTAPGPTEWHLFIDGLHQIGEVAQSDERLSEIWRGQWEGRARRSVDGAVAEVIAEMHRDAHACSNLALDQEGSYLSGVDALAATQAAQRGSGTKTALLAALAAWLFEGSTEDAVRVAADAVGTDTDSIASMAGAISGAATPDRPRGELVDRAYIAKEADRMWAASIGDKPPRFPYPDVLEWKAPRAATDAALDDDGMLHIAGLGPGEVISDGIEVHGQNPAVWQWVRLWFGQAILVKRRHDPERLNASRRVTPTVSYADGPIVGNGRPDISPAADPSPRRPPSGAGRHAQAPVRREGAGQTVDEITDRAIAAGLTDDAVGAGLRQVSGGNRSIEDAVAYAAIIAKALRRRGRTPRR